MIDNAKNKTIYNLQKFIDAHNQYYNIAKQELSNGKKQSHYMWFIFPQIKGLGFSPTSKYYAINNLEEAKQYMENDILKSHMEELLNILLNKNSNDAHEIFGSPDDLKLKSSLTLFKIANPNNPIFNQVLVKFFNGEEDFATLNLIKSI